MKSKMQLYVSKLYVWGLFWFSDLTIADVSLLYPQISLWKPLFSSFRLPHCRRALYVPQEQG